MIRTPEQQESGECRQNQSPILKVVFHIFRECANGPGLRASPGLHLGLRCFLGCDGRSPMRRVTELCWGAVLLAQGWVGAVGLRGLGVLPMGLLLLLFIAGQAEEEA